MGDFGNNRGRSYEMEDIYGGGRGGGGMHRGGFNQNPYDQNQYNNNQMGFQNQQVNQFGSNFNQQQQNQFQDNFNNNSVYEHLTPTQYNDPYGMDQGQGHGGQGLHGQQGNPNLAYDPYDNNNTNLPGY